MSESVAVSSDGDGSAMMEESTQQGGGQDEGNHKGSPYKYNDGAGRQRAAVRITSEVPPI